jgi:hypothetical protein
MKDETYNLELTDEEKARVDKFAAEAKKAADEVEAMFSKSTRGMMKFLLTMRILQTRYPASVKIETYNRVAEWFAAGEPDDLSGVADKILKRCGIETRRDERPYRN